VFDSRLWIEPADHPVDGTDSNTRDLLRGNDQSADEFRIDRKRLKILEEADIIFDFDRGSDTIVINAARSGLTTNMRYDSSLDLDGDGNRDTVIMASNGGAYLILDDYVITPATAASVAARINFGSVQLGRLLAGEFSTTEGSNPQANILVGTTGSVDKFEIDIVTEIGVGQADIIHRFDKAGGDKIKLVATGGAPAFNGMIHFDSNADWNGDGTKDTILHVNGRALAIIHGQSIDNWVANDFEDGTVTGVSELDFTVLPDIS